MSAVPSLRLLALCAALALTTAGIAGCKDKSKQAAPAASAEPAPASASSSASLSASTAPAETVAATPSAATSAPTAAVPELVNVAGMSAGAFIVNKSRDDSRWLPLINEVSDSVGVDANGDTYTSVIALAAPAAIERLRFTRIAELSAAQRAQVQVSEQGADGPWRSVFDGDLAAIAADRRDSRSVIDDVVIDNPAPARFVRVTWQGGHGGVTSMRQFAALAKAPTGEGAQRDVSGVYRVLRGFDDASYVAIRQEGATIRGCYGEADAKGDGASGRATFRKVTGAFEGGVEPNGYLRFTRGEGGKGWRGVMSFSPDGNRAAVLEFPASTPGNGKMSQVVEGVGWKVASYQKNCPGLDTEADPLDKTLETAKRVTLYGVNFDIDADTLRPESKPTLDGVAKVAKSHPDWHLAIEGHTDNTGGATHNDDLSKRRADSVRKYLVDAGVKADQLGAQGFGASRPVAPNDSAAGRAQNRRVEVARQ